MTRAVAPRIKGTGTELRWISSSPREHKRRGPLPQLANLIVGDGVGGQRLAFLALRISAQRAQSRMRDCGDVPRHKSRAFSQTEPSCAPVEGYTAGLRICTFVDGVGGQHGYPPSRWRISAQRARAPLLAPLGPRIGPEAGFDEVSNLAVAVQFLRQLAKLRVRDSLSRST